MSIFRPSGTQYPGIYGRTLNKVDRRVLELPAASCWLDQVGGDAEILKTGSAAALLEEYSGNFSSLTHGLVHSMPTTLFSILSMQSYVTIFKPKSGKYLLVNLGYWFVCLSAMAIIISLWGGFSVWSDWIKSSSDLWIRSFVRIILIYFRSSFDRFTN